MIRVRFHIIRDARIENVGKSQSCMVSKLRIIWKQTVFTMKGDERVKMQTSAIFAPGKTVVLFALPGAFTPG